MKRVEMTKVEIINEIMEQVKYEYECDGCPNVSDWLDYEISIRDLMKIMEQIKEK